MARIRTIKPAFFRNHKLYTREAEANAQRQPGEPYLPIRVAFAALFTVADRAGRFVWREHELKLDCLPYDPVDMGRILTVLQSEPDPYIIGYEVDGKRYGYIPTFLDHQRPKCDEAESVIPPPPGFDSASPLLVPGNSDKTTVGVRSESNRRKGSGSGSGKGSGSGSDTGRSAPFVPPTVEEVRAYCLERNNNVDPQAFCDHYAARDWKPKGYTTRMKDWRAAVRTWERGTSTAKPAPSSDADHQKALAQAEADAKEYFGD